MNLLKLGRLNIQPDRWKDALSVFNSIVVIMTPKDEPQVEGLSYHIFESKNILYRLCVHYLHKYNEKKKFYKLLCFTLIIARLSISRGIKRQLKGLSYDEIHVSYNDFDESALLLCLFKPYLKKGIRITRSYKETRPAWSFLEYKSFLYSDRIVLNEKENLDFFVEKYGNNLFVGKNIVTGLDEDAIGSHYCDSIEYQSKLSEIDKKKHIVLLSGRVMSDSRDIRSGSRLYYIPLIKSIINCGLCVHLHTLKIYPDANGIDQYKKLQEEYPNLFFIENPLKFDGPKWKEGFRTLSRYDMGILHNYIEGTSNKKFDEYNIPHRYYEYQLAHVAPILQNGETKVMQRLFEEQRTGILFSHPIELLSEHKINFKPVVFKDYIKELYTE